MLFRSQVNAHHAMTVLLKDAFRPNIVQTLEGNPAIIHGGPFANIAHGCNSVIATKTALKMSEYTVTEAGFGADLGAEKFFNIKCRKAGLAPDAVVLVATIRALKHQGGIAKDQLNVENTEALLKGCVNLGRHIRNLSQFGVPIVVAINNFVTDTEAEFEVIREYCKQFHVDVSVSSHWEHGGDGAIDLAEKVVALAESGASQFKTLYDDEMPDRKSTRLNSSHVVISYAVFCLKKKKKVTKPEHVDRRTNTQSHTSKYSLLSPKQSSPTAC